MKKVKDCPTFKEVAKIIAKDIEGCDLAGFNSVRFDLPLLAEEFLRAGVDIDLGKHKMIDVQVIFHKMEQRTWLLPINFIAMPIWKMHILLPTQWLPMRY